MADTIARVRAGDASRAEIVAALSIATDMAMGQRLESGLRICHTALALAEEAGLGQLGLVPAPAAA